MAEGRFFVNKKKQKNLITGDKSFWCGRFQKTAACP